MFVSVCECAHARVMACVRALEFAIHELRERQIMAELILNFFFSEIEDDTH